MPRGIFCFGTKSALIRDRGAILGANEIIEAKGSNMFADTFCKLLAFEFEFKKKEEFEFDEFIKKTGWNSKRKFRNTCGTRYKSTDYHLHLAWKIAPPDSVVLTVEFARGYRKPDEDEKEPFAEEFVQWLRQFVRVKDVRVDIYSDFEFPRNPSRTVRFPLPMRAPIGPQQVEVEIDGLSFKISPALHGIEKVWLTQGPKNFSIHLHAEKAIEISSFDPRHEILTIASIMESMFETQKVSHNDDTVPRS